MEWSVLWRDQNNQLGSVLYQMPNACRSGRNLVAFNFAIFTFILPVQYYNDNVTWKLPLYMCVVEIQCHTWTEIYRCISCKQTNYTVISIISVENWQSRAWMLLFHKFMLQWQPQGIILWDCHNLDGYHRTIMWLHLAYQSLTELIISL